MKVAAILASLLVSGCAHRPARVAWQDIELGHGTCGPRATLEVVLDRTCTLVVTANRETPRHTPISAGDCDALLALAADRAALSPACTVPQPFIAGVAITLDDGRMAHACWDDALATRMAALGEKVAPDWRRGMGMRRACDFSDDVIEGDLVAPTSR